MATIIALLEILSIVGIWYFWKKSPNKKGLIASIILLFVFGGLYSTTSRYKADEKSQEESSSSLESSSIKESKKNSSSIVASSKKKEADKKAKSSVSAKSKANPSEVSKNNNSKELLSNSDVKSAIKKYSDQQVKVKKVNGVYTNHNSKDVTVELKGQDVISDKMTAKGFLADTRSVWIAIKKSGDAKNFENVNVSIKYPLQDTAGNSSNEYVMKTSISGSKIQNLNVDNFLAENVPNYADNYWQSNAFPRMDE